jgi:hypothetical protein
MNTKKFEVRTFSVETRNGKNPIDKFFNQGNQDTQLVASFISLDEAKAELVNFTPTVEYGNNGVVYYHHECAGIEENIYDEDGEWVSGGDWWDIIYKEFIKEA